MMPTERFTPDEPAMRLCRQSSARWQGVILVLVLVLGLALGEYLAWWKGNLLALAMFQKWALEPSERAGWANLSLLDNNYPPVYSILLRLLRWVHRRLHLPGDFTLPLLGPDDLAP